MAVPGPRAELLSPPVEVLAPRPATAVGGPPPPNFITVHVERLPAASEAPPPVGWSPGPPAWGPAGTYPPADAGGAYPAQYAGGAYPPAYSGGACPPNYPGGYPAPYAPGAAPTVYAPAATVLTAWRRTEPLAVASAICGFTAFVPVLSQIIGLALGIASLLRIRRARRNGVPMRGALWAWMGIGSSGFVLLCWLAVFAAFVAIGASFQHTAGALDRIMPNPH